MTEPHINPYRNYDPYIPASLSEIYDQLGSMMLGAPTFVGTSGYFPERNLDSEFKTLVESFGNVRKKLGEARYAALIDLAARAKALFAADPEDANGKTREGIDLLYEIEGIIQSVRRGRAKAKLPDEDGDVTGD